MHAAHRFQVTIWIDADTLLIRRIFEDAGRGAGGVSRMTTTFEPQANPTLDDTKFTFTPPVAK